MHCSQPGSSFKTPPTPQLSLYIVQPSMYFPSVLKWNIYNGCKPQTRNLWGAMLSAAFRTQIHGRR